MSASNIPELRPDYPRPPIGSVRALARTLGSNPEELWNLASQLDAYRPAGTKKKADGSERPLWEAKEPLKTIQGRIKTRILQVVDYPDYLQGALAERDYVTNASLHSGKRALLSLDISNFYPSCSTSLVRSIWTHFFHFPPDVSELLTLLTTRDGSLPQGASPSSYLANLAFWHSEGKLSEAFRQKGLTYTRYVDDIHVSADRTITNELKSFVIQGTLGMISPKGFSLHRGKLQISDRSKVMTVHRLNVKSSRPTLLGRKRDKIRATVHSVEKLAKSSRSGTEYRKAFLKARGQAALLKRFHPAEGQKLLDRVSVVFPVPNEKEVASLRRRVDKVCRSPAHSRQSKSFKRRVSRIQQELGELKRSRPMEVNLLRVKIRAARLY